MHPTLKLAIETAESILKDMTANDAAQAERVRLKKLTKEQVIEELLTLKFKRSKPAKVEDLVYAIMCTPECAALSHSMIAVLVVQYAGSKTTKNNIGYYASRALEKGYDTVPRITQADFERMLLG